jgi:hypothetical protein
MTPTGGKQILGPSAALVVRLFGPSTALVLRRPRSGPRRTLQQTLRDVQAAGAGANLGPGVPHDGRRFGLHPSLRGRQLLHRNYPPAGRGARQRARKRRHSRFASPFRAVPSRSPIPSIMSGSTRPSPPSAGSRDGREPRRKPISAAISNGCRNSPKDAAARDRGGVERTERPSRPLRGASGRGRLIAETGRQVQWGGDPSEAGAAGLQKAAKGRSSGHPPPSS